MNINIFLANELYALGFTYHHYQEHFHKGMVFQYDNSEWVLGGNKDENLTEQDIKIIDDGVWLPSVAHLIEWLQENSFRFSVSSQESNMLMKIECEDSINGTRYSSTTSTLEVALACLIKKILKKGERQFDINIKAYGTIEGYQ
jgi:hypothetical protein